VALDQSPETLIHDVVGTTVRPRRLRLPGQPVQELVWTDFERAGEFDDGSDSRFTAATLKETDLTPMKLGEGRKPLLAETRSEPEPPQVRTEALGDLRRSRVFANASIGSFH
jgi:hypothetical protein